MVTDDSDGSTLCNIETPVVVIPNNDIIMQLAESFLNENPVNLSSHNLTFNSSSQETSLSLVDTLKNSDLETVSTFIMIFTTMLNSQTVMSSNSSNVTNSTIPDINWNNTNAVNN